MFLCLEREFTGQITKYASHVVILHRRKGNLDACCLGSFVITFIVLFGLTSYIFIGGLPCLYSNVLKKINYFFLCNKHFLF